jgi:hypothetical protein
MQMAGPERTRLFVDGVRAAITADVAQREHDCMIVTQALPFLRLDTSVVEDDGTRARITWVGIDMDGDVPRLVLELAHEDEPTLAAPVTASAGVPARFTPGVSTRPPRTDSTVPYDLCPAARTSEKVVGDAPERSAAIVRAPARPEPWWTRLAHRIAAIVAALTRRPLAS